MMDATKAMYGDIEEVSYEPASTSDPFDTFTLDYPVNFLTVKFTRGSDLFGCVATFQSNEPTYDDITVIDRPEQLLVVKVPSYEGDAGAVTRKARLQGDILCNTAFSFISASPFGRISSSEDIGPSFSFPVDYADKRILKFSAYRNTTVTLRYGQPVAGCEIQITRKRF